MLKYLVFFGAGLGVGALVVQIAYAQSRPAYALNHVGIEVADIDATIKRLRTHGMQASDQ